MLDSGFVCGIDLLRVVAAEPQPRQLLIRQVLDHRQQARVCAEEMLAEIGARFGAVLLPLAVNDFAHALDQQAFVVIG